MSQSSFDEYSILYVDFEYKSEILLGYGCISKRAQKFGYKFIYKGDLIPVDNVGDSYSEKVQTRRILNNSRKSKQKRILRQRGIQKSNFLADFSVYNFSEVKLPPLCVSSEIEFEELIKSQTCYVTFFKDASLAYSNSQNRLNLIEIKDFALISFIDMSADLKDRTNRFIFIVIFPILFNCYPLSYFITKKLYQITKQKYVHFKE